MVVGWGVLLLYLGLVGCWWFVLVGLQVVWFVGCDWGLDFWFCVVMLYVLVSGFGWVGFAVVDYYGWFGI